MSQALCAFSYLQVRRTNRSIGQISSRHDDEFVLDLRTFCAAELPEGAMRPAPTGQVNLKTLVRRLRVVVSQTLIMAFTALAFFVVLAWKTVNETRSLTDRIALETIRLLLLCVRLSLLALTLAAGPTRYRSASSLS